PKSAMRRLQTLVVETNHDGSHEPGSTTVPEMNEGASVAEWVIVIVGHAIDSAPSVAVSTTLLRTTPPDSPWHSMFAAVTIPPRDAAERFPAMVLKFTANVDPSSTSSARVGSSSLPLQPTMLAAIIICEPSRSSIVFPRWNSRWLLRNDRSGQFSPTMARALR